MCLYLREDKKKRGNVKKNSTIGVILVSGFLVSCASPDAYSSVTPNLRNLGTLETVNTVSIRRLECADPYSKESIVNGLTDGLLSKGINVVNGESADAFIEGVVSGANDVAASSGGSSVGSAAFGSSAASSGGYVNNIAVKVISKTGELLGTAQVSQTRNAESTPYPPAYEGRRLGIAISKLFDKNEHNVWKARIGTGKITK